MMKSNRFIYYGIGILLIAIIIVLQVKFKFFIKSNEGNSFKIEYLENLSVKDLNGEDIKFLDLLNKNVISYCMIFELSNCNSCIIKGLEDLKKLRGEKTQCMAVIVHDLVDEASGWSIHQDFFPFFVMNKRDFYEYVQSALLPVIVRFENEKVVKYRYIII
jgi:hypothetical protein